MSLLGTASWMLAAALALGLASPRHIGPQQARPQADFYVAPDGNDAWSGRLPSPHPSGTDGPFATLARAQLAVREARSRTPQPLPTTVLVRGGTYPLSQPIVFAPSDSGTANAPVTYANYPGETPAFSGGRAITGWQRQTPQIWTAPIPDVAAGRWYFHQLFVNGQRRTRARTPNQGYLRTAGPLPGILDPRAERDNPAAKIGFRYRPGDLQPWDNMDDVTVVAFHAWTASLHYIAALDPPSRTVTFTAPSDFPFGWWEWEQRYYVENHLLALDSPGEWYLDRRTGVLHYWPSIGRGRPRCNRNPRSRCGRRCCCCSTREAADVPGVQQYRRGTGRLLSGQPSA